MRATLTRGSMTLGEDDGGLPPQSVVQDLDTILADSRRLVETYHERGAGAQVQIALAPCSPFSVTTDAMRESAALAEELDVRLHTHLAETVDEEDFCRERFGMRTVDYLESVGWLTDRAWLGHGIHLDDDEVRRPGRRGPASRTARRRTCASRPASPGPWSWRTRARPSGSGSTAPRRTTPRR